MLSTPYYTATSYLTTGAFAVSLVRTLTPSQNSLESDNIKNIKNLEKAIFFVATGQYVVSLFAKDFRKIQQLRYLDWVITTPMLLRTLHLLAEEKGFNGSFLPALGFNILMIVMGYFAENSKSFNRAVYLTLGFLAFAGVLKYVYEWGTFLKSQNVDVDNLLKFFYIGWTVYGLNFMTPNEEIRQSIFNIADLFNKGIYSIVLDDLLKEL